MPESESLAIVSPVRMAVSSIRSLFICASLSGETRLGAICTRSGVVASVPPITLQCCALAS